MEYVERMTKAGLALDAAQEIMRVYMEKNDLAGLESYVISCEVCAEVL